MSDDFDSISPTNSSGICYYSVLGLCKQATPDEIRAAYRNLALKWHPDRRMKDPTVAGEAKKKFQEIQQAYSVLSDKGKKSVYDAGLFDLLSDDDDEGFSDFMQEMAAMMHNTRRQKGHSLEELQGMLLDMINADCDSSHHFSSKRTRTS